MAKIQDIRIATWNANSVNNKKDELFHFITSHSVHIMTISETHLKNCHKLFLPNFKTYCYDRSGGKGGGTAILINNRIPHDSIYIPTKKLENVGITLKDDIFGNINLFCIYRPPNSKKEEIARDLDLLIHHQNPCIIMGDFNSQSPAWHCSKTNVAGNALLDYIIDNNLNIVAPTTTTHPHRTTTTKCILDFAVTSDVNFPIHSNVIQELSSDHFPVMFHLSNLDFSLLPTANSYVNWGDYANCLSYKLKGLGIPNSTDSIDELIIKFNSTLLNTTNECSYPAANRLHFNSLPKNILELIKLRNKARKIFQTTYFPPDYHYYIFLKNKVNKAIKKFKKKNWEDFTATLEPGSNSYWRLVKTFTKNKSNVAPLYTNNDSKTLSGKNEDKVDIIGKNLQDSFRINPSSYSSTRDFHNTKCHEYMIKKEANSINNVIDMNNLDLHPSTPREIGNLVNTLKNKCTPGEDGISNKMLKQLPIIGLVLLANLFNSCLRFGYFPNTWKAALISPIAKPGKDPHSPESYRPISLLSSTGKLFEKLIMKRLKKFQLSNKIIPDNQFGFRSHLSATHQVLRTQEIITKNLNLNRFTAAIFVDITKAFDKVWHEGLIVKLIHLNLPGYLLLILRSFILNRTFRVKIGNFISDSFIMQAGIAQGSVMAPILFSIYIGDIPPNITNNNVQLSFYADDSVILSSHRTAKYAINNCQKAINQLNVYFKKWKILINPSKSQTVLFRPHRRSRDDPTRDIVVDNTAIKWSTSVKYLGVILDDQLKFKEHLHLIIEKAYNRFYSLMPLFRKSSKLSTRSKLNIYKIVIRSAMLYSCPCWAFISEKAIYKLQIVQNRILRKIVAARWFIANDIIHRDLDIPSIFQASNVIAQKFFKKNWIHSNSAYTDALSYDWQKNIKFKSPRSITERGPRPP